MTDLQKESGRAPGEGDAAMSSVCEQGWAPDHGAPAQTAPERDRLSPLFAAGFELIPLHAPDALDRKGRSVGKAPLRPGWRRADPLDLDEAVEHMVGGCNVGVRLRATDLVVDADPRHYEEGDDALARLVADFGLSTHPRVVTGGGGIHLYLTKPADVPVVETLDGYPGVEFKTLGRQVVAPGSVHPETRRTYRLELDPLDDAVAVEAPARFVSALTRPEATGTSEVGSVSSEQLDDMLGVLDPTAYRDQDRWLTLMMACHHATAGAGREEFVAWSTSDPKYADDTWIVGRRWDSLHADAKGRRVTERTLYKWVIAAGGEATIPRTSAEEDFASIEDAETPEGGLDTKPTDWIDDFNARFCVAPYGKEVFVFCDLPSETAGGRTWEPLREHSFRLLHKNDRVLVDAEKGKRASKADLWLESARRRTADRVVFDPAGKVDDRVLNTWRGWPERYAPKPGDWSLMRRVIVEALTGGDEDHAEYVLRWMAFCFQRPADLPRVALVFRGGKGTGKGTLGRVMHDLAGDHALSVTGLSQVAGRFNAHLRQKVFVFADEAFASGDREAEAVLKRLITEPQLTFEGKGVDARNGPNYCKLILASNEEWVVPASGDERRYAAFDVAPVFQSDGAFWDALHRQLDAGGRAAMLHDLLAMDIRGWHPQDAVPQTSALSDQKLQSLDSFERWWLDLLEAGSLPDGSAWVDGAMIVSGEPKDGFLHSYQAAQPRGERPASIVPFAKRLGRVGVDTTVKKGGTRAWWVPSLTEARDAFVAATGLTAHSWGT